MIVRGFSTSGTGEKLTPFPCGAGGSGTDTDDQQATEVPYDNSGSGLTANDVQEAIDELAAQVAACCTPGADISSGELLSTGEVGGGTAALEFIAEHIASGGSQADITFSSIPGTYRDLVLVCSARGDTAATEVKLRVQFNGDTGSNYDFEQHFGDTASAAFDHAQGTTFINIPQIPAASHTANYFGASEITIHRYKDTDKFKDLTAKGNEPINQQRTISASGVWKSTAAITSIRIFCGAGNIEDNSVFTLFGRG